MDKEILQKPVCKLKIIDYCLNGGNA